MWAIDHFVTNNPQVVTTAERKETVNHPTNRSSGWTRKGGLFDKMIGGRGGGRGFSSVACLSQLNIDHASLSTRKRGWFFPESHHRGQKYEDRFVFIFTSQRSLYILPPRDVYFFSLSRMSNYNDCTPRADNVQIIYPR